MRALVISGGGSKGAFAGGIAQYLTQEAHQQYDFFLGSSTGSLLISHLALGELNYIQSVFTSVTQAQIFSNCPFTIRYKNNLPNIAINPFNVLKIFIRGQRLLAKAMHSASWWQKPCLRLNLKYSKKNNPKSWSPSPI